MKFINKLVLAAGALAAVAVPVGVAASSASAATVQPAVVQAYHQPVRLGHTLKLTASIGTFTYTLRNVYVDPDGVVSGTLHDQYAPVGGPGDSDQNLALHGLVRNGDIVLFVTYPNADGSQGIRFFDGSYVPAGPFHAVSASGVGTETGAEGLTFSWTLS